VGSGRKLAICYAIELRAFEYVRGDMAWEEKKFESVDTLLAALAQPIAYRGQSDASHRLLSSLDRRLPPNMAYESRLAEEEAIIVRFCRLAYEFCDTVEQAYLQGPMPKDRIKTLPILRHYGAPTRLLDWTWSPLVALYFAAAHEHGKDGAIWWFDQSAFDAQVHMKWKEHDMEKYREQKPDGKIDLNTTAFNSDGRPWISPLRCTVPFHRIGVQQGFFTVAGRLGYDHGDRIEDLLTKTNETGRIIVPRELKAEILHRLRLRGIDAKSLDYPGADAVGQDLKRDLESRFAEQT
jgi:hypothetical protein